MRTLRLAALIATAFAGSQTPGCDCDQETNDREHRTAPQMAGPLASSAAPSADAPGERPSAKPSTIEATLPLEQLVRRLSEPSGDFFSDNYVSNETSYLQVAVQIMDRANPGGVYIGVGPEQNYTYIALSKPRVAFIVDLRRDNLLLHLLYKAAFERAHSRSHFVTLLLGREYDSAAPIENDAPVHRVLSHATRLPPSAQTFAAVHERLRAHLDERVGGGFLTPRDWTKIKTIHRALSEGQLELRFRLHEPNGREYPTLGDLFGAVGPTGEPQGFLATDAGFRVVQALHQQDRIVPVVGDFAGDHTLPRIAEYLREIDQVVSIFYVSNVEQYLLAQGTFSKWAANVAALPTGSRSLFIRAYLDQGRAHPQQQKGHRTTTVLQTISRFVEQSKGRGYRSFYALATDQNGQPPADSATDSGTTATADVR